MAGLNNPSNPESDPMALEVGVSQIRLLHKGFQIRGSKDHNAIRGFRRLDNRRNSFYLEAPSALVLHEQITLH